MARRNTTSQAAPGPSDVTAPVQTREQLEADRDEWEHHANRMLQHWSECERQSMYLKEENPKLRKALVQLDMKLEKEGYTVSSEMRVLIAETLTATCPDDAS